MTQERCPIFRCTSRDGRFAFDIMPGQSVSVGRSNEHSDLVIDSNMLSRLHAIFHNRERECVLEYGPDTGSCILVNGERVSKEGITLNVGDSIKFNSSVIFELGRLDEAGNLEPHVKRLQVVMQQVCGGNLERRIRTQRPIRSYDWKTNTTHGVLMLLLLVFVTAISLWVVIVIGLRLATGS